MGEPENNEIAGLPPVVEPILPNSNSDDKSQKIGERSPSSNEEHGETFSSNLGSGGKSPKNGILAEYKLGYVISYDDSTQDGYIRIEDIEDRIYFKRTDVKDQKDLSIGVAVTCGRIEKKEDGTLCAKDITYEHVEGKVINYNEETKEGYLSKNVCFNSKDIKGHFPIIKDANVSYDVIFSANGTKYAKNIFSANGTKYAKNIEAKSTPTIKLYSRVYGEVSRAKWEESGYITIKNNEDIKDRVCFDCSDVDEGPKHVPNGAMVTCDIHKKSNGQLVAKNVEYKHVNNGTVLKYDENTHEGFLTKNVFFRSDDIIEHYLVIPGSKVSYDDVIDENDIHYAKNIKVLSPFHGKVKTWKKEGKGSIYIQELEKVVDVVSEDVKNFNHTLLEKAKVKCYLIKDGDKLCAKQVFSKRLACHLPIWCLIVGLVVILISTYKFKINFWIPYLVVINVITFILYLYDKKNAMDYKQRIPESILHLVEFGGGSPMAYISQRKLRHKSKEDPEEDPRCYYSYPKRFNFILLDQAIILAISACGTLCFNIPFIDTFIFLFVSSVCAIIIYNLIDMIRKRKD